MKIVMLDIETLGADVSFDGIRNFGEVITYPTSTQEETIERIKDAEVVILNKIKITKDVLNAAKKLKLICVSATGYDNIDLDECRKKNVAVCNVVGYSSNSVAQVTLAMVLSLSVNLSSFSQYVKDGSYSKSGVANKLTPVYHELAGKVWGIIGYGNIGKQVGKVAQALGCRVIVNKRTACDGVECVDLKTLCKISDIITIHTPLTDATRKMINNDTLSFMKENVILVNVARGAVTDEKAICEALKNNKIGAFGTDVYSIEPFGEEHPFYEVKDMKNVCLTPHMAWGAFESRARCIDEIAKNIGAFINGEKRNRVDL